jgi:hypothetical protein
MVEGMNESSKVLTLGDVERMLDPHGISLNDLKGLRVVPDRRGDRTSPMHLEAKVYLRNDDGKRWAVRWPPDGNYSVAYERFRIPVAGLRLTGMAEEYDPVITWTVNEGMDDSHVVRRRASEVIEAQRDSAEYVRMDPFTVRHRLAEV